jgi:uncharacterized damage-inducible protein DinB
MAEPEFWLRGAVPGIAPLLQPVAHSLLQAEEDVRDALAHLGPDRIWLRPSGAASIGFHVQHLCGSLDRLFTYARGAALSDEQAAYLHREGDPGVPAADAAALTEQVRASVEHALAQLRATPESTLGERRDVGRKRLPSTVLGLLFHAAEHTTRHAGQIITTARIVAADQR